MASYYSAGDWGWGWGHDLSLVFWSVNTRIIDLDVSSEFSTLQSLKHLHLHLYSGGPAVWILPEQFKGKPKNMIPTFSWVLAFGTGSEFHLSNIVFSYTASYRTAMRPELKFVITQNCQSSLQYRIDMYLMAGLCQQCFLALILGCPSPVFRIFCLYEARQLVRIIF